MAHPARGCRTVFLVTCNRVELFAPWAEVQRQTDNILQRVNGRNGHIYYLGHGILPDTPVENVRRLVAYVHEQSQTKVMT